MYEGGGEQASRMQATKNKAQTRLKKNAHLIEKRQNFEIKRDSAAPQQAKKKKKKQTFGLNANDDGDQRRSLPLRAQRRSPATRAINLRVLACLRASFRPSKYA